MCDYTFYEMEKPVIPERGKLVAKAKMKMLFIDEFDRLWQFIHYKGGSEWRLMGQVLVERTS